jgi:hypothetical protein
VTIRELIQKLQQLDQDEEIDYVHINAKIFSVFIKGKPRIMQLSRGRRL